MSTTETKAEETKTDEVSIQVNNKAVSVPKHTTGAEIKSRAGVPATFQLFRVEGKSEHPVADDDEVTVHEDARHARNAAVHGPDASTLEAVELHLRADKNLSRDDAEALSEMFRLAYDALAQKQARSKSKGK